MKSSVRLASRCGSLAPGPPTASLLHSASHDRPRLAPTADGSFPLIYLYRVLGRDAAPRGVRLFAGTRRERASWAARNLSVAARNLSTGGSVPWAGGSVPLAARAAWAARNL